jgi:hypothetical protein
MYEALNLSLTSLPLRHIGELHVHEQARESVFRLHFEISKTSLLNTEARLDALCCSSRNEQLAPLRLMKMKSRLIVPWIGLVSVDARIDKMTVI